MAIKERRSDHQKYPQFHIGDRKFLAAPWAAIKQIGGTAKAATGVAERRKQGINIDAKHDVMARLQKDIARPALTLVDKAAPNLQPRLQNAPLQRTFTA
jgi:hypothetical protein